MAKRSYSCTGWTPVGVAVTTNFTDNGYKALQGGSTTQLTKISEVNITGLAAAAAATPLVLAFDSTVGATSLVLGTNDADAPLNPLTAALAAPVVPFSSSTTKPKRAATLALLDCGLNAFGGIRRWVAAPDEEIWMYGNAVNVGEVSLSCMTNGSPGLVASHIIYETL